MSLTTHANDLLFPPSSTLLITGANGSIASNIITEALSLGFKVRGTVRIASAISTLSALFNTPNYSTVVVSDFVAPGAFDEAVRSVSAIILTATKLPGPVDPHDIVPETIASVKNILESAAKEKSVKRVVYTGTIPIVFRPGQKYKNDANSWADEAVAAAFAPPPYGPDRIFVNYKAAKHGAEKALFEFVRERKPNFTVNSVLPVCVFGRVVTKASETGEWPRMVLKGEIPPYQGNGRMLSCFVSPLTSVHVSNWCRMVCQHDGRSTPPRRSSNRCNNRWAALHRGCRTLQLERSDRCDPKASTEGRGGSTS